MHTFWEAQAFASEIVMRSFTKAALIVLLTVGAAGAQDQVPLWAGPPARDPTADLVGAVHAACPSPPPTSQQDYNAKRSVVNGECGAVSLKCSNVSIGCLEASYKVLPASCKAALVELECAVAGLNPPKKASSP
jgi:hypothetical protein